MPMSPERRHEPLGSYRAPPDRPYSVAGQATYHISPERRYDPPYHSSPERRSQQESGYLSSPERRVDHQQSFSGYSTSSSYEESLYGGSIYGTRSGSVTPVIDEEARYDAYDNSYMDLPHRRDAAIAIIHNGLILDWHFTSQLLFWGGEITVFTESCHIRLIKFNKNYIYAVELFCINLPII